MISFYIAYFFVMHSKIRIVFWKLPLTIDKELSSHLLSLNKNFDNHFHLLPNFRNFHTLKPEFEQDFSHISYNI